MKAFRTVSALAIGCAVLGWMATTLPAAQQSGTDKPSTESTKTADKHTDQSTAKTSHNEELPTFLGVVVAPVHPRLAAHFAEILGKDKGVEVEAVAADSPAAKAGIKPFDILISFADQKLSSPEQLLKLVHAQKPGAKVALSVLHNGKTEQVEATLEQMKEQERPLASGEENFQGHHGRRHHVIPRGFAAAHAGQGNAGWERFDSMTVEKTGKDAFKVSIRYLNDNGKMEEHQFKGTRSQLAKDIHSEKDMPHSEQAHLLSALNVSDNSAVFPGVRFVPGEGLIIDLDQFAPDESQQQPNNSGQF